MSFYYLTTDYADYTDFTDKNLSIVNDYNPWSLNLLETIPHFQFSIYLMSSNL